MDLLGAKGTHGTFLEGLCEEEGDFEREIDIVNSQKKAEDPHQRKESLKDLLNQMDTENPESTKDHFQAGFLQKISEDPSKQFQKKKQTSCFFDKIETWKADRIQEEVSEQPPPKNNKLFDYFANELNFEKFDNQLKQHSNFDIKPLSFYLKEEDPNDDK